MKKVHSGSYERKLSQKVHNRIVRREIKQQPKARPLNKGVTQQRAISKASSTFGRELLLRSAPNSSIHSFMDRHVSTIDGPWSFTNVPGIPAQITTATGVVATTFTFDPDAQLTEWTTWAALFEEFHVERVRCFIGVSRGEAGHLGCFIDELNPSSNPVLTDLGTHRVSWVSLNNAAWPPVERHDGVLSSLRQVAEWVPTDLDDADWYSTSSPSMPDAAFKLFTNTTLGVAAVSEAAVIVQLYYDICFRLFKS